MSAPTRMALQKLRAKYARQFGVHVDNVRVVELEDEDGEVYAEGQYPRWTLGFHRPARREEGQEG